MRHATMYTVHVIDYVVKLNDRETGSSKPQGHTLNPMEPHLS